MIRRVLGGTPVHGGDLCAMCSQATIRSGFRLTESDKWCDAFQGPVPYAVATCSGFRDKRLAHSSEFYKTAWILVPLPASGDAAERWTGMPPLEYRRKSRAGEVE